MTTTMVCTHTLAHAPYVMIECVVVNLLLGKGLKSGPVSAREEPTLIWVAGFLFTVPNNKYG